MKTIKKNNLLDKLKLKAQKIISSMMRTRSEETIKNYLQTLREIIKMLQYILIMKIKKIGGKMAKQRKSIFMIKYKILRTLNLMVTS